MKIFNTDQHIGPQGILLLPKTKIVGCSRGLKRFFLFCLCLNIIQGYAFFDSTIYLNEKHKSLSYLLEKISRKNHIHFLYKDEDVISYQDETVQFNSVSLDVALHQLLKNTALTYSVRNGVVIIRKKELDSAASETVKRNVSNIYKASFSIPGNEEVTGKVVDSSGKPIAGAAILLNGSTAATYTNDQGEFTVNVQNGDTIKVKMLGYTDQEWVYDGKSPRIVMVAQPKNLEELVVTALGISRKKSAVVYDVAEVKGNELTQAKENNVANALSGKVAGVNATGISTGPGGSSRIIIRGNGSLTGANQPLYVINGMPMDNTVPGGSSTPNGLIGNVDRGDGIGGINPDDIESISVLKGGAAAALYGSLAANGVILITTKKGRNNTGLGITYNGSATFDNIAVYPDWQYEYGQGDGGAKPTTQQEAIATGRRSFGAKIDGSTYIAADGEEHPYSAVKDNLKHFYQTGQTYNNSLAISGGNTNITYRFSMMDLNAKSILPNSKFDRKTFNLNVAGKLSPKLSFTAMAQYNYEKGTNRATAGDALGNPNWLPFMIANTADVRWLKPGYDSLGNEIAWNDANIASNGYFVVNKVKEADDKNRFIGQFSTEYKLLDNLAVKGVISQDQYNYNYQYILPYGTLYVPLGQLIQIKSDLAETNSMLTVNYTPTIGENFSFNLLGGVNKRKFSNKQISFSGQNFIVPYFYSLTNLESYTTTPLTQHTETNSAFGSLDIAFKDLAFLSFTGRNDWFSTLSLDHNSIFYPSVGGSILLHKLIALPQAINYFKLRTSWAQVGGATPDPYVINIAYSMVNSSTLPLQNVSSSTIANKNLKPLLSTTYEGGFELQMLNSRLGIDVTWYKRKTTDDIVTTAISVASGYNYSILNAGAVSNQGIELLLTGKPIRSTNFQWNSSFNFAYNKNRVDKLTEGLDLIQLGNSTSGGAYIDNMLGQPYGVIVGTRMARNDAGQVIFNSSTGYPVQSGLEVLGNGVPPYTAGLSNEFRYKRFGLNILLDGKFGNKVFSVTDVYGTRMGLHKMTLGGRENGLEVSGVDQTGEAYSNTIPVASLRSYYDNYKSYSELFVHDGSFIKLRQVVLSYNVPLKSGSLFKSATVSLIARNLLILYKKTDNFDPETSITNGAAQGIESFGLPRTKNIGINFMVNF
ncbi:MAG: SusC/RagA family TonB-linked outer membrane protein [Chitinophagaceae bacterium]